MRQEEHSNLEATILSFDEWTSDCIAGNISAGTYLSIEGAGREQCEIINKALGPFRTIR